MYVCALNIHPDGFCCAVEVSLSVGNTGPEKRQGTRLTSKVVRFGASLTLLTRSLVSLADVFLFFHSFPLHTLSLGPAISISIF